MRPISLPRTPRGFTIIELVVCLAVLAVLSTAALPLAELAVKRQKERELRQALWEIRTALDEYRRAGEAGKIERSGDESGYPRTLLALADGVRSASAPADRKQVYFLRRIPRDPFHQDSSVPAHLTWGLRSYSSPHDRPQPGEDVYDVYSTAPGVGLNGVPYREW